MKKVRGMMGYVERPAPDEPTCASCSVHDVICIKRKGRTKATAHICTTGNFQVALSGTCLFHHPEE